MKANILDCTLRDGGYYNNWLFSNTLINKYIKFIENNHIHYLEIGFRFFDEIRNKGRTAYCDLSFIKSLKFKKEVSIGIMFNGSDIVKFRNDKKVIEYFSEVFKTDKLKFIRIACHFKELEKISFFVKKIKKSNKQIMINLMQISEIKKKNIKTICKKISKLNPDVFYIADSLGSMTPNNFRLTINQIKKYWHGELGVHAHNNKKLALENTLTSNSLGVKWLDCTITGMGRGAGNTLTEDLLKKLDQKKFNKFDSKLIDSFMELKKKYNWGPSKIYEIAADYKIHPTYIQLLLTGKPFAEYRKNIKQVLINLKKSSSKFEINKLYLSLNSETTKYRNNFKFLKNKLNKDVLIIGSKEKLKKDIFNLKKLINNNDIFTICLNDTNKIKNNFCDIHVVSHPLRIVTDFSNYSKSKKYVLPFNMLSKNRLRKLSNNFFNVNIKFGKNQFNDKKKFFELNTPLALGLALQIALKIKTNKIILYGFSDEYSDLYQKSDVKSSKILKDLNKKSKIKLDGETDLLLRTFKKQNSKVKITSINF